jgi:hypothetical protein
MTMMTYVYVKGIKQTNLNITIKLVKIKACSDRIMAKQINWTVWKRWLQQDGYMFRYWWWSTREDNTDIQHCLVVVDNVKCLHNDEED